MSSRGTAKNRRAVNGKRLSDCLIAKTLKYRGNNLGDGRG
jgi:hypothetical protein